MSSVEKSVVVTPSTSKVLVSTVLLDHPIGFIIDSLFSMFGAQDYGDGMFETMVFAADEDGEVSDFTELYCERYDDEKTAKSGHARIVAGVEDGSITLEKARG